MALTKVTSGLISADASSVDLNIDAGTLYIDSTNNRVGIGTGSPQARLHVSNGSAGIEFGPDGVSDGTSYIQAYDRVASSFDNMRYYAATHSFYIGESNKLTIDSSGNVGIGVTPASAEGSFLQFGYNYSISQRGLGNNTYYDGSNWRSLTSGYAATLIQMGDSCVFYTASTVATGAVQTHTERFRIGPTEVKADTEYLKAGPNWSNGFLAMTGTLSGYSASTYPTLRTNGSNIYFDADNTYTGYIGGSTGFTDVSDAREKENVVTIDDALDKVANLRGVYHTWKDNRDDGRRNVGFIAQEVMEVLPEVVTEGAERYGVAYGKVAALLVEAIKELKEKNDALEARIQTLEGE